MKEIAFKLPRAEAYSFFDTPILIAIGIAIAVVVVCAVAALLSSSIDRAQSNAQIVYLLCLTTLVSINILFTVGAFNQRDEEHKRFETRIRQYMPIPQVKRYKPRLRYSQFI